MLRVPVLVLALSGATLGAAQCPSGGLAKHDRCWYLSDAGATCSATCAAKGLGYSWFLAPEADPVVPQLLGRAPSTKQFSWARTECYVPGNDRYHTAKKVADSNSKDTADPGAWGGEGVCRLACSCASGGAAAAAAPVMPQAYPACVEQATVLRHAGAHAIFTDLSEMGSAGCWQNDCKNTDKFNAVDKGVCARACAQSDECTHWSFGEQDGTTKCFLRKSDAGREQADGFMSAAKACGPTLLPPAFVASKTSELLVKCDSGKNDACPDIAQAINTWKFAIKYLKKAVEGKVDANTAQFVNQVSSDTDAFAAQMSEENFPIIVGNNRQVFTVLAGWMAGQPGAQIDPNDTTLPNPVRGKFCGPTSCYDAV